MSITDPEQMREAILTAIRFRKTKERLSPRKEADGTLTYQSFIDRVEKVEREYYEKKDSENTPPDNK